MSRPGLLTLLLCQAACFAPVGNGKDPSGGSTTGPTDSTDTADPTGDAEASSTPTTGSPDTEPRTCTWKRIGDDGPPLPRYGHSLDLAANGTLIMFGGRATLTAGPNFSDVWQYKNEWQMLMSPLPPNGPTPRRGFAAAVHPDLGLVMFGGDDDINNSKESFPIETWVYANNAWKQLPSASSPPGSANATMEYHPASSKIVMFGGHDIDGNMVPDTWLLDVDGEWTTAATDPAPEPRAFHTMAREPGGDLLMHGGCTMSVQTCPNPSTFRDDTWLWDGAWTLVDAGGVARPPSGAMTPGTADGTIFRFARGLQVIDTYQWLGDRWMLLNNPSANPPDTMEKFAVAYYPASNDVILYGGLRGETSNDETWTFHCDDPVGS